MISCNGLRWRSDQAEILNVITGPMDLKSLEFPQEEDVLLTLGENLFRVWLEGVAGTNYCIS